VAAKTLEVRVRADVGAYQKAMSAAVKSTDQLGQSALRIQKVGIGLRTVGDDLTKKVTLPLVAIGAVATKMALDFDNAFTTMQTLAGVTGSEVDGLKDKVLGLSGETGRAPQELAEALYFLQSSGLDSAQAMDALEVSAKGSAAGLGSTVVIADAVSSAMLGYAQAGLTAAEATDVLVATARAGKAEPAELASQMGRLVPVASELGISFDQVGGAIAALSTKGFNAEQATTALTNVMAKLLKPSIQAEKALEAVGLSTDSLRQMIAEKGLLGTLEELKARLGDAGFVKFLEDQQAVQGGLALLGGDLAATKAIMDEVANSAGATENAFSTWADSMGAKNARAFAQFQIALIRIGDVIAPIATDILNFASMIVEAFASLPNGAQKAIVFFGLIAASVGPLLSVGGRLITLFGTTLRLMTSFAAPTGQVTGAFNRTGAAASSLRVGLVGLATAIVAAAVAVDQYNRAEQQANTQRLTKEFLAAGDSAEAMDAVLRSAAKHGATELIGVFGELASTNREAAERFYDQAEAAGASESALSQMRDILDTTAAAEAQTAVDTEALAGEMEGQAGATAEATSALQEYSDALKAMTDPLFGAMDAITGNRDAQLAYGDALAGVMEAQAALDEAISAHGTNSAEAAEATRGLEDAQRAVTDAQWGTVQSAAEVDSALAALKDAVDNGDVSMDSFRDTLATWVAQGYLTQAQADAAAASVLGLAGEAEAADQQRVEIPVGVPGSEESRIRLRGVRDGAHDIPGHVNTNVTTSGAGSALSLLDAVKIRIQQLDGSTANVTVNARATSTGRIGGVPIFHGGGVVEGAPRGTELLALVQSGEGIISLDDMDAMKRGVPAGAGMGGGGHTTVVNYNLTFNGPTNDKQVIEAIKRHERNNGPGWRAA